jgi:phosphate transport system substrate-binding protein
LSVVVGQYLGLVTAVLQAPKKVPAAAGIDYNTAAAGAYPLVLVTYEVVCQKVATPLITSFLKYLSCPAGKTEATRLGYAPLPEALRTKVADGVAALGR